MGIERRHRSLAVSIVDGGSNGQSRFAHFFIGPLRRYTFQRSFERQEKERQSSVEFPRNRFYENENVHSRTIREQGEKTECATASVRLDEVPSEFEIHRCEERLFE